MSNGSRGVGSRVLLLMLFCCRLSLLSGAIFYSETYLEIILLRDVLGFARLRRLLVLTEHATVYRLSSRDVCWR